MQLDRLNKKLEDEFGRMEDRARYRVVFSEDELEMRHGTYRDFTREGIFLREVTETRQVPKYKQWVDASYILERVTILESFDHENSLIGKLSYEPLHVFRKLGKENVPTYEACKFLIQVVIEGTRAPGDYVKYKDPEGNPELARALKQNEVDKLIEELFGNETDVTDALAHKSGIVVPGLIN